MAILSRLLPFVIEVAGSPDAKALLWAAPAASLSGSPAAAYEDLCLALRLMRTTCELLFRPDLSLGVGGSSAHLQVDLQAFTPLSSEESGMTTRILTVVVAHDRAAGRRGDGAHRRRAAGAPRDSRLRRPPQC